MQKNESKTKYALSLIIALLLLTTCLISCDDTADSNLLEIGISSEGFENQYYQDIEKILLNRGFTNIITRPEARGLEFWKLPNTVKRITVNGEDSFTKHSKFPKDALIVIIYYSNGEENNGNN